MNQTLTQEQEGITKKQFMKMLAEADVDDTVEFWESVYDGIQVNSNLRVLEKVKEMVGFKDDPECEHRFNPAEDCTNRYCELRFRRKLLSDLSLIEQK